MDGAHNPMKIAALVRTLGSCYPKRKMFFVFGAMKDKNVKEMMDLLSGHRSKVLLHFF